MLNVLLMLNVLVGYESNELPMVKVSESNSSIVTYNEVKSSRRFLLPRINNFKTELEEQEKEGEQGKGFELPYVKESRFTEFELLKREPIKKTLITVKSLISGVNILPRNGTLIKGNAGMPVVIEEKTTMVKTIERKDVNIKFPIEENEEKSKFSIYEDRRIFSGRVRSRIFNKSR